MRAKAQIALEFMVLFSFVILVFLFFFAIIGSQRAQILGNQFFSQVQLVAQTVATQMDQALQAGNGYSANVTLVQLGTVPYSLYVSKGGTVVASAQVGTQTIQAVAYSAAKSVASNPVWIQNVSPVYKIPVANGTLSIRNSFGTICLDFGCPNTSTVASNVSLSTQVTHAALFNGQSSYASIAYASSFSPANIAVAAWVNPNSLSNSGSVFNVRTAGNVGGVTLEPDAASGFYFSCYVSGAWYTAHATSVPLNKWTQLVGTYNGSKCSVFVNGRLFSSNSIGGSLNNPGATALVQIGKSIANGQYFTGDIANIQVYSAPLSASQVSQLYGSGIAAPQFAPLSANVIAWYPLNSNANDYSGNGDNGVFFGPFLFPSVAELFAKVTNIAGQSVSGVVVGFTASLGNFTGSRATVNYTDSNGAATAFLTQQSNSGQAAVRATALNANSTAQQLLEGWWPLNEGQGTTAYDVSGNGNAGAVSGTSFWSRPAYSINFDGLGGYINLGTSSTLNPSTAVAIVAWINPANTTPQQEIAGLSPASGQHDYSFYLKSKNLCVAAYTTSATGTCSSGAPIASNGAWYQVAFTAVSGGAVNLYVNGVNVGSGTAGSSDWAGGSALIGDLRPGRGLYFYGKIADVQLYSAALSASQVSQLYKQGMSGLPLAASLAGWWPLGGDAVDYSGNGNNGVVLGGISLTPATQQTGNPNATSVFTGNFNGVNSMVTATVPQVNKTSGYNNTVTFWMNWTGNSGQSPFSFNSYGLRFVSSTCFGIGSGSGDAYGVNPTGLSNRWVFVAAQFYNGAYANGKLYINGVPQALSQCAGSASSQSAVSSVYIGNSLVSSTNFGGSIAGLMVYSKQLTLQQIQNLYLQGIAAAPLGSGLVAWYPLDGNANDYSGNGNNGVANSIAYRQSYLSPPYLTASLGTYGVNLDGSSGSISANVPQISTINYNTVSFWMYWNGGTNQMPISMHTASSYSLWFSSGTCFGFSTGNGDAYGVNPSGLANKWVYVTAEFYNGPYTGNSMLYIDAVPQTLTQCAGVAHTGAASTNLYLGQSGNNAYFFGGQLADVRVFSSALSQQQVQKFYYQGMPPTAAATVPLGFVP